MDYKEALKQYETEKKTKKQIYLQITFGYQRNIILPYEEGIKLIAALEKAENLDEYPSSVTYRYIEPIGNGFLSVTILNEEQYRTYKLATLLQVDKESIKHAAKTDS